ncbi:MAG: ACT domain-containing protein [Clostridiales bacterium]|nr:ACT domain-containing protein [Clostridiales bacterium]
MKAIVTVIGKDKPGIIAKVSTALAQNEVNIEDISQTIMQGNFTMLMQCDFSGAKLSLKELKSELLALGEQIGVSIHVQHEDIFNAMHKI